MATRIKRYEDRFERYDALLSRIEAEMGPAAELQTREFRRGALLGVFGGQRMVEVVATLQVELTAAPPADTAASSAAKPAVAPPPEPRDSAPAASVIPAAALPPEPLPVAPAPPTAPLPLKRGVDFTADEPVALDLADVIDDTTAIHQADTRTAAPARQPAAAPKDILRETAPATAPAPSPSAGPPSRRVKAPPAAPAVPASELPATTAAAEASDGGAAAAELGELKHTIAELKQSIERLIDQQQPAGDAAAPASGAPEHGLPATISAVPAAQPVRSGSAAPRLPGTHQSEAIDTLMRAPALFAGVADPLLLDHARGLDSLQRRIYDRLLSWNIGPYDALELLNAALAGWQEPGPPDEPALLKLIFREICSSILLSGGIQLRQSPPGKAVALVGATGVGKTTTIAKLAAHFAFQQNRRVSLVSLDNYRIAAAEQLRTYTEIMGIDLDIVFSRDEFDSVMTQRRQGDLVLIDTAGRSPLNQKQIYELRDIFSAHPPDEVHLVISASTKGDDLRGQLENFKPLSYDHVIITKLDETLSLGSVYNLTRLSKMPISYFAIGQSVPEDFRPATLAFVQAWIEQGRIS